MHPTCNLFSLFPSFFSSFFFFLGGGFAQLFFSKPQVPIILQCPSTPKIVPVHLL